MAAEGDSEFSTELLVTLHDLDRDRLDLEALSSGIASALTIAHPPELRVVVSGNFEAYVRQHEDVLPELPPYVQARVRGRAVGKILQRADGEIELLVDASMLDIERPLDEPPERLFAHEALHLVVIGRGESTNGRRARLGHELGTVEGAFAGMAGHTGEEFRVERALHELGYPLGAVYRAELDQMADDYAQSLARPFWEYQRTRHPDQLSTLTEAAVRGFEHLVPVLAYIIGDDVGAGVYDPPLRESAGPDRWFYQGYVALFESLAVIPSATTACSLAELDELLDPVASALKKWLAVIGFRWSGGPVGYRLDLVDPDRTAAELDASNG